MDYAALKNEIQSDPVGMGYAQYTAIGADSLVAALLNSLTGAGAGIVTLATMPNADFVTAFLPYLGAVFALPAPKAAFYTTVWQTILAMPNINFSGGNVSGLMAQAVTDGLLTSGQAAALNRRTGSRAEVIFGPGSSITHQDIAKALRS